MSTEKIEIGGVTYLGNDALSFGDYGGAGSHGRANIDDVLEQFAGYVHETSYSAVSHPDWPEGEELIEAVKAGEVKVIRCTGMYSSETVYIREDVGAEIIGALENYPVLDEERMSEVEMEWEREAWDSWLQRDLLRTLPDDFEESDPTVHERASGLEDSVLFECYREAMDKTNTYPVAEYSGVHVDVDRIKDEFLAAVMRRLDPQAEPGRVNDKRQQEIRL